jgi:hypothetical protein
MSKVYGAGIRCAAPGCGKEPFAVDPALECHELRRFAPDGSFSASPAPGVWLCPEHAPPKQRTVRAVRRTPLEAIDAFERLFADEGARLTETLADSADAKAEAAFDGFRREIERGLGQLREAIALDVKPPASDTPKPRRSRQKAITARERNQPGQTSLIEEELIRDTS